MEALKRTAFDLYFPLSKDRLTKTRTIRLLESATKDDNFGASLPVLQELAEMSTWPHEAPIIASFLTNALRAPSYEWRRIYKSLHVAEYLLSHGSPIVISHLQPASTEVRYLCDFVNISGSPEHGEGSNTYTVQIKAKLVYSMMCGREMKKLEPNSGYDIAKGSCFAGTAYTPPNTQGFGAGRRLWTGEDTVRGAGNPALRAGTRPGQPPQSETRKPSALFDRLSKPKPAPTTDIDLLSIDVTETKKAAEPLDLLDFHATGEKTEPGKELLGLEPILTTEPSQVCPSSPKTPTPGLPHLPQSHSSPMLTSLPKISHNLAPASQQPSFPLPTKPTQKVQPPLSLDTLVSGLDRLSEETQQTRNQPKKQEFVINI